MGMFYFATQKHFCAIAGCSNCSLFSTLHTVDSIAGPPGSRLLAWLLDVTASNSKLTYNRRTKILKKKIYILILYHRYSLGGCSSILQSPIHTSIYVRYCRVQYSVHCRVLYSVHCRVQYSVHCRVRYNTVQYNLFQ